MNRRSRILSFVLQRDEEGRRAAEGEIAVPFLEKRLPNQVSYAIL